MRSRDEILRLLLAHREELQREFGVEDMALFGSVSRNDARSDSDVDVLVDIPHPLTLFQLVALQLRLEDLLNVPRVDVVLADSIHGPLMNAILAEAVSVA
jgi:predicted nucleotidyltransferase